MLEQGILVGTDFSDEAARAVEYAATLASQTGVPLVVVHCWNESAFPLAFTFEDVSMDRFLGTARTAAESALAAEVERLQRAGVTVSGRFAVGPASRELPRLCKEEGVGLLVLARCGAAGQGHVRIGSAVERVIRGCSVPTLVVAGSSTRLEHGPRRLLVGVDLSRAAADAVRVAMRLSETFSCSERVMLAHAYQDERALWLASASEVALARPHELRQVRTWMERHGLHDSEIGIRFDEGLAEVALIQAAEQEDCDWIVLGVQGRTALASFLLGSTTLRILEGSDRPVLVVPPLGPPDREEVG